MGKTLFLLSQNQLVNAMKTNNKDVLKQVYTANYPKIETLILKNSGTTKLAKDIYQEAFITVWTAIKQNNFKPQNEAALQNYLFKIAKNKYSDFINSKKIKNSTSPEKSILKVVRGGENKGIDHKNIKLETTMEVFKNLEPSCKQLLKAFYYEKQALKDVALKLNLKESEVSFKKHQYIEKLRNTVTASIKI